MLLSILIDGGTATATHVFRFRCKRRNFAAVPGVAAVIDHHNAIGVKILATCAGNFPRGFQSTTKLL